jgi:symplekin
MATTAPPTTATSSTIAQLDSARNLALGDANYYPKILTGILPLISGAAVPVELQRWGADFIAETFASPVLSSEEKGKLAIGEEGGGQGGEGLSVLRALKDDLEGSGDAAVAKSVVQAAASVYPLVFRHT